MKTVFPTAIGFSGTQLVGLRKAPIGDGVQRIGAFVLKREYRILGESLVPTEVSEGIRFKDLTQPPIDDIPEDESPHIFVTAENDLAPFKPLVDIVVEGGYQDKDVCTLWVEANGKPAQLWFSRPPAAIPDADDFPPDTEALQNMFGWQPRHLAPRSIQGTITTEPADPKGLEIEDDTFNYADFNNEYFNGFRRTWQVTQPASQLAANSRITIYRHRGADSSTWQFDLADEQFRAHFFVHDGLSVDKERNWCKRPINNIKLDTIVVSPDEQRASLVWRGFWPYDAYPEDRYRMVKVNLETQ